MRVGIDQVALYNAVQFQDLSNPDCQTAQLDQQRLSEHAFRVVQFGFGALDLQQLKIKDNIAHSVRSTPHLVVLRCLNQLIRQSVKIEPSDRDTIIRRLATVLQEGVPHRIYKFDIKAFFDSVDCKELFGQIANEIYLPRSGVLVLQNFLNELANRNIRGLNRFRERVRTRVLEDERVDYFSVVSLLFYFSDSDSDFIVEIEKKLTREFLPLAQPVRNSHDAHFMLDLIACPYLTRVFRSSVLNRLLQRLGISSGTFFSRAVVGEIQNNPWFVNWKQIDLLNHLRKKELRAVY